MTPHKIVVPLDGSPAALRALEQAIAFLAGCADGEIILVHVQSYGRIDPVGASNFMPPEAIDDAAMHQSQQALAAAIDRCTSSGVTFQSLARMGETAHVITDVTKETGADQIVMGTRGLGSIQSLVLGSVATKVVHLTNIPVTLVK
jgi:nucleotide-binding universal stress UspA family protein